MKFTIALAQVDSVLGDVKKNIAKHIQYVHKAKDGGADIVIFPELSLSGYSIKDINWDVAIRSTDGKVLRELLKESKEISIVLGCVEESTEFRIFNSAFFLEDGLVNAVHRKVYPPTYGMFEEIRYFSSGKNVQAFDSKAGRLGMLVCEDLWHLPLPYILAKDGANVIIGIAASPTRVSGNGKKLQVAEINSEQHRSLARLLSSYVVFVNRVGFEDGVNFWGGSEVIGPSGDVVVRAKYFDEDIVFVEIDDNEVRRARRLSRHFLDDDVELVLKELKRVGKHKHHH
jgi:predicted amidohydrolase